MISYLRFVQAFYYRFRDCSAALLGAGIIAPWTRRCCFLATTTSLFLLAILTPAVISLYILALSVWLLLATYFVWGSNEKRRGRIAKKIDHTQPDSLPDLRGIALMTAFAVPCFLPVVFEKVQSYADVFALNGQPGPFAWMWFFLDHTYFRAIPDSIDLGFVRFEGFHGRGISFRSGKAGLPGRILVTLAYSLVYLVLIQGLLRIWQIRRDIKEGMIGTLSDPEMGVRLGRRAVKPLLARWSKSDLSSKERANILIALGQIGDPSAFVLLHETAIRHPDLVVREAGLAALSCCDTPKTVEILSRVLLNKADTTGARATAASALGKLRCSDATAPLLNKLTEYHQIEKRYHESANVRKEVIRALGNHLEMRRLAGEDVKSSVDHVVKHLLADEKNTSLLEDIYLRVRNATAVALSRLGDVRGVDPILQRLADPNYQNPKLIHDTILALGNLIQSLRLSGVALDPNVRSQTMEELARHLKSSNDSIRQAAARGLGLVEAMEMKEQLFADFKSALKTGQEALADALKESLCAIDPVLKPTLEDLEKRTGRLYSQRRRQTLLDAECSLPDRLNAAMELGEYQDKWGLKALRLIANNPTLPEELRKACEDAIRKITDPEPGPQVQ